ncbi:tail length tape measure protein [Caulobacter phage CcrColossus]|uniref:Putative tail tape measure protein n=1 Tax=Caulobacter phage CcrColossus TaxID=1211640 RepID=K4JVV0_9CAUD|nr:tail length tape measure protein [Caulobacter phage CcrColossus]AFU87988.1 putative tail tape measure protein [Caulobacter phage CcrColossus]
MDTQPLKLKVDSGQAQADLAALARSLDSAGVAALKTAKNFETGMAGVSKAINGSLGSMEKFAKVAGLLSKIKMDGSGVSAIGEFAKALNQVARVREIEQSKLNSYRKFIEVGAQVSKLRFDGQATNSILKFSQALDAASKARAITPAKMQSWVKFIEIAARASQLRFSGNATSSIKQFAEAMDSIAKVRAITPARVQSIKSLFEVLGSAKGLGNAGKLAGDLNKIAEAAGRASTALNSMPSKVRAVSPGFQAATKNAESLHKEIAKTPGHAGRASKGLGGLIGRLGDLGERFKLSYQAGTAFSAFFSAFTFGQFLKSTYDTNIALAKLQKALLFSTGTFKGAHEAMDRFVGTSLELGLNIEKTAEAYGRFTLSAKASGIGITDSEKIFKSVAGTLQVVGANSEQTELAFYGLTQMIQKGKVSAEEFNRQIGEQIPGNAVIGARALSKLEGRVVSVAEFFKRMSLGQIMSTKFVPAYAEALQEEFGDLLKVAQRRPDVALNKLTSAFTIFKKSVGEAGFMASLGREFGRLTDKIIVTKDGQTSLTPAAQRLADTLGKNLASMVRLLGKGLEFLVENLDSVVAAIKGLAALKIGATFMDWTKKANGFAGSLIPVKNNVAEVAKTEAAIAGAGANAATAAAATQGSTMGGPTLFASKGSKTQTYDNLRKQGYSHEDATFYGSLPTRDNEKFTAQSGTLMGNPGQRTQRQFGRRVQTYNNTTNGLSGNAVAFGMRNNAAAAAATQTATKGAGAMAAAAKGATMAFTGLRGILNALPGIAVAAGIALAVFSDKITGVKTAAGNDVQVGDIASGALGAAGKDIGKWFNDAAVGIGALFGVSKEKAGGKSLGEWLAWIAASLITLGKVLFSLADSLGKVIGTTLASIIGDVITFARVTGRVFKGDFAGAKQIGSDWQKQKETNAQNTANDIVAGTRNAFNVQGVYNDIMSGAKAAADNRNAQAQTDAAVQAENADIERQMAARQQAFKDQEAAAELEALRNRANLGNLSAPSWDSVFQKFADAGKTTAEAAKTSADAASTTAAAATVAANGVTTAAKGTAPTPKNQNVAGAITDAARVTGVSEEVLKAIAYRESGFNPTAAAKTSSARGLFQFTYDTARQYGLTKAKSVAEYKANPGDAFNAQASSLAAGRYAQANAAEIKKAFGRDATGGEIYASHFMGSGGVVDLIKAVQKTPNASFEKLFPAAAKANGFTQGKTVSQVYKNLTDTVGGSAGTSAAINPRAALDGITEVEGETLTAKYENLNKQLAAITSQVDPAADAIGGMQEILVRLSKLGDANAKLVEQGVASQFTPEVQASLQRLKDKLTRDITDAVNPFIKDERTATQANEITKLRLKGMQDEAEFKEKLNGLYEQGYDISKLDTQENRNRMKATRQQTDALAAQLEVVNALNDAQQKRIERTGSAADIAFARGVKLRDGQSLNDAISQMSPEELAARRKAANIAVQTQRDDALYNAQGQIQEMVATAGLKGRGKSLRDDYKSFLEDISGLTDTSLSRLEQRAGPELATLAKKAAEIKDTLENPPGFQRWADGLTPLKERLEEIKAGFADDLSSAITDALSGEDVDWRELVHNASKQMLKAQVDNQLGGLINMFTGGPQAQAQQVAGGFPGMQGASGMQPQQQPNIFQRLFGTRPANGQVNTGVGAGVGGAQGNAGPSTGGGFFGGLFRGLFGGGTPPASSLAQAPGQNTGFSSSMPSIYDFNGSPSVAQAGWANGTDLQVAGPTVDTSSGLGQALSFFGLSNAGIKSETAMSGASAFGGNTAVTTGIGSINGPTGAADAMNSANISVSNAQVSAQNMTVQAQTVNLSGNVAGGGGAGGAPGVGPAGAASATGGLGGGAGAGGGGANPFSSVFGGGADLSNLNTNTVSVNDAMLTPYMVDQTGGPGFVPAGMGMPDLSGMTPAGGGGITGWLSNTFGNMGQMGQQVGQQVMALAPFLLANLTRRKDKNKEPKKNINGVIGEARPVEVSGTQVSAHGNIAADLINMGLNAFTGNFGAGGGWSVGQTFGNMGASMSNGLGNMGAGFSRMFGGGFSEGGYTDKPVHKMALGGFSFANAPHYSEGTPNTSGGMPAILHPNEAVIPLSRGRSIPVELPQDHAGPGMTNNITSRITVVAPNPDAFRKSSGAITRQQNRDLKRAALRNLSNR